MVTGDGDHKNIEDHQVELAVAEPEAEVVSAVRFETKTETVAEVVIEPRDHITILRYMHRIPIVTLGSPCAGISGKTNALLGTEFEDALLEEAMSSPAPMGMLGCGFECLHNKQFSQINMNQ
ncbi:hypothetical protein Ancab_031454 [Ancistrocladus abbreviatus]